jgi:hypothetical protein
MSPLSSATIATIGSGVMAEAMVAGLLRGNLVTPDQVVASFLVGRVRGAGLDSATRSLRARLRSGWILALIDLHPDPAGGPPEGIAWSWHEPVILEAALARAGFETVRLAPTGRFFLLGTAVAA